MTKKLLRGLFLNEAIQLLNSDFPAITKPPVQTFFPTRSHPPLWVEAHAKNLKSVSIGG